MLIKKAYKFKLKTNTKQKNFFLQSCGCVRFVWNKSLALQKSNIEYITKKFVEFGGRAMNAKDAKQLKNHLYKEYLPTGFDISKLALASIWKKSEELEFLNECPAQALQKTLADLHKTLSRFFNKKGGFPKFKKKGKNKDSIHFPQGFKVKKNMLLLPKIGWIKFFKTREIIGKIKNVTVTCDNFSNWFVSFYTEHEVEVQKKDISNTSIGIDLGITTFAALSNGELIKKPESIKKLMIAKKRASKALSRKKIKKEGTKQQGKNREKAKKVLAKTEAKIANIRRDFHNKLSTKLSKNHALIVVEDLKISNMSKSAKGTIEKPGKNVKAKSGLNREILSCGWYSFKKSLEYKQKYSGGLFASINPINTSRKCSSCSSVDKESRVRQQ